MLDDGMDVTAYFWVTGLGGSAELASRCEMQIPLGAAYIWGCKTHESHRNRGLYTQGLRQLRAVFSDAIRILIAVESHNVVARKGIAKAGFEQRYMSYSAVRLLQRVTISRVGSRFMVRKR